MKNLRPAALAFAAVALLTACSSNLSSVKLQGSSSVASASVLVDVVGISANNQSLTQLPVRQYWASGSASRRGDGKSFRFGPGSPLTYTLDGNDPIWDKWRNMGVKQVMVIADLPGAFSDAPGDADPRRKLLPISSPSKTATVTVDKTGLLKSTP